jgi:enoyl-CoA hydratase
VRLTRQAVRECIGRPEVEALALEELIGSQVYDSYDAQEGPRAFLEKRPPRFEGR